MSFLEVGQAGDENSFGLASDCLLVSCAIVICVIG